MSTAGEEALTAEIRANERTSRNRATCKYCGNAILWVAIGHPKFGNWKAVDPVTKEPHPRCVQNSKLKIYRIGETHEDTK